MEKIYDLVIIGGGPAGLTASIYALRAKKSVLLIERMVMGGQIASTTTIENYPGFEIIDGTELAERMFNQASKLGLEVCFSDVLDYDIDDYVKKIKTYEKTFLGKTVLLCLGASAKQLNISNEKKFLGKGISYCATCDGNLYKGKTVAIVGGGDSAIDETLYLANIVGKIYLIHRRDRFKNEEDTDYQKVLSMSQTINPKIEIIKNSVVEDIQGENKVEKILVRNKINQTTRTINIDCLFVVIGRKADTSLLAGKIDMDENGFIITDELMKTNIDGVFAGGDVRKKVLKQIVTACADGAIATVGILEYINKNKNKYV